MRGAGICHRDPAPTLGLGSGQHLPEIQGVSFNWSYPKIHEYGKKLKYQNWSSLKIHKYQNWYPPQICNYGAALKVIDFQVIIMGSCAYGDGMNTTQGKIDLRNESGRPMKVKVVGEVSEK